MSDIAISVENLSKSYLVGHNSAKAERYTALRDVIANNARNLARKTRDMFQGKAIVQGDEVEEFWALKNVSFEIKQGDRVGIIGRNGAGKSTLLKILSRITEPTSGRIKIQGRVASLLEVGTGFHPELTGRENIFLNGAILGMSRNEIQRKFDEIVAFAEVERFLDTPVKRYSSGMYVRLAFAVAAHLEPEILIVDEVLAVGDAEFQKKCLGKMQDVAGSGRTIIFVSHNMAAVRRLCSKGLLLEKGQVTINGDMGSVIDSYIASGNQFSETAQQEFIVDPSRLTPSFVSIKILNSAGKPRNTILFGEPFQVILKINNPNHKSSEVIIGVEVLDNEGLSLFTSHSDDLKPQLTQLPQGCMNATCIFNVNPLMPGNYSLQLGLVDSHWGLLDYVQVGFPLYIDDMPYSNTELHLRRPGKLVIKLPWELSKNEKYAT